MLTFIILLSAVGAKICFDAAGKYIGNLSVTQNGFKCKRWDNVTESHNPDGLKPIDGGHHNY